MISYLKISDRISKFGLKNEELFSESDIPNVIQKLADRRVQSA